MNDTSKVSVILCTYNGEKYIKEQLDTIINQTYPVYEIVIQDDNSTDSTFEILKKYSEIHERIRLYQNVEQLGAHLNFINCCLKSTGDFIMPSDQDDIWVKDKVKILLEAIDNKLYAFSQSRIVYEDHTEVDSFNIRNPYITISRLLFDNRFPGHASIFDRKLLKYFEFSNNLFANSGQQMMAHDQIAPLVGFSLNSYRVINDCLQIWRRHDAVCNQEFRTSSLPAVSRTKKINGKVKFVYALLLIAIGKRSLAIYETFLGRSQLIYFISKEEFNARNKKIEQLAKLAFCISTQSIYTLLVAGKLMDSLDESKYKLSGLGKYKRTLSNYIYPAIYWYDNYKLKYL